jgi:hypothetical protein
MARFTTLLFTIVAALAPIPGDAEAQTVCGPRKELIGYFGRTFGEMPAAIALTDLGALLEVLVSPQGSWTIILTRPGGQTCVVATGANWQPLTVKDEPAA